MGTPFVILVAGQDNVLAAASQTWTANPKVKVWNNEPDEENSPGTAFVTPVPNAVSLWLVYASLIADAHPDRDVYVIRVAHSGSDILSWVGGGYWTVGAQASGHITFNAPDATNVTQIVVNETNIQNIRRPAYLAAVGYDSIIRIKQNSNTWEYRVSGAPGTGADSTTYPVTYVSGPVGTYSGNVMVETSPSMLRVMDSVVPAALGSIGIGSINTFMWWHGTGDARYNTIYGDNLSFLLNHLSDTRSWFSTTSKIILCGIAPSAVTGNSYSDTLNTSVSDVANADGSRRYYANIPGAVATDRWTNGGLGMTSQGYLEAASYIANSVYSVPESIPIASAASIKVRNATGKAWLNAVTVSSFKVMGNDGNWIDKTGLTGVAFKGVNGNWYKK